MLGTPPIRPCPRAVAYSLPWITYINTSLSPKLKKCAHPFPHTFMSSSAFGLCWILFTAVIVSSRCLAETHTEGYYPYQREFDYFALALQWPGTYCQGTRYCCPTNGCCRGSGAPMHFTIHGLWPDYNDGTWPSCCTKSRFVLKEISSLLGALQEYWPSLSCGQTSTCSGERGLFWAHEWEMHGTCSYPVFRDEYSYFVGALNLYFKYNVTKILAEAGIVPSYSEKYPLGAVVSAIENAIGASPELICSYDNVEELRICFYKDFEPRDCIIDSTGQNHDLASRSSCPSYVGLPKFMPLELDTQEGAALSL